MHYAQILLILLALFPKKTINLFTVSENNDVIVAHKSLLPAAKPNHTYFIPKRVVCFSLHKDTFLKEISISTGTFQGEPRQ